MGFGSRLATGVALAVILSASALAQVAPLPLPPPPSQSGSGNNAAPSPLPPLPQNLSPVQALPRAPAVAAPVAIQKPAETQALPQVAAPPAQSPMLDGLYMPGIVEAFLGNKPNTLPDSSDIRRFVFSIYAGMAQACVPHSDSDSLSAMVYVERGLGPGREAAEVGLRRNMGFIRNPAQMHKAGDLDAFTQSLTANSPQVPEGFTDGATIVSKLRCQSREYGVFVSAIERLMQAKMGSIPPASDRVIFASLMSPGFRDQLGIEDPAITLKRRRIEKATAEAQNLCTAKYDSSTFCGCLFGRLKSSDLSEREWEAMSAKFTAVVTVAIAKPSVAESIRSCNRGS